MKTEADFAEAAINQALSPQQKLHFLREIQRIRSFEVMAIQKFQGGHMAGWLVLQSGQDGIPVAVRSLLGPADHSICGFRGIGHALAAGMTMRTAMAELYGKVTGSSRGKAGMHGFYWPEGRHWGNHAIAGTQTALAAGLAFGLKHRDECGAVCCFLGDGAMNQGVVHESMNLASLMDLPVVFIIENNQFGLGTSVARSSAINGSLAQRAEAYGIPWDMINGDSPYEIRAKLQPALECARHQQRPTVLEIATYRFEGFSVADANKWKYRTQAEVNDRTANHDPLKLWQAQLLSEGIVDTNALRRIRNEAQSEAEDAAHFANQSPFPSEDSIFEDIYGIIDHGAESKFCQVRRQWVKQPIHGRHFF